jgi:ADP-ribose pyrophosphatase YjhB (NUDIX family)
LNGRYMTVEPDPRFCRFCGGALHEGGVGCALVCSACHRAAYAGPSLLVLALLFAEDRVLLMKRGTPPYVGTWAPPGGFVEAHESAEAAAAREVAEEVGIVIDIAQLHPLSILSIPAINQVCVGFVATLDRRHPPRPSFPEALDARWFTLEEWPTQAMWPPAVHFDIVRLFEQVRSGQFHFYQWTGEQLRSFGPIARRS